MPKNEKTRTQKQPNELVNEKVNLSMDLNESKNLTNQRARAAEYIKRGLSPIPVKFMGEEPLHPNWQNLRIGEKDIDRWFPDEPTNIGVRLGEASGGLVDIYMVDEDARRLAEHFLPHTNMKIGTPSRPSSHWMYVIREDSVGTYVAASGIGTLIELLGTGHFTVFPGSVDASGEAITFEKDHCYPRSFNYENDHFFVEDVEYLEDCMNKLAVATVVLKRFNSEELPYLIESATKFLGGCVGWGRGDIQNLIECVAQERGLGQGTGRNVFESILESGRSGLVHCLGADVVGDMESWYNPRL